jgi:RNA polymerase sigma-B factor
MDPGWDEVRRRRPIRGPAGDRALEPVPAIPAEPADRLHGHRAVETNELFAKLADTDDPEERDLLRARIVDLNLDVVRGAARRYRNRGVPLEDLEQVGCLGLVKAINRFRPEHGSDFLSYAVPTITGELKRYFRDRCWVIRPTRQIQELQPRAVAAAADLRQALGRDPTLEELTDDLGEDRHTVRLAVNAHVCYAAASLDSIVADGQLPLGGVLGEDEPGFATAEARAMLAPALSRLTDHDRRILTLRFYRGLSQREIGAKVGLSQMQISRILSRLLFELRGALEGGVVGSARSA